MGLAVKALAAFTPFPLHDKQSAPADGATGAELADCGGALCFSHGVTSLTFATA